MRIKSELLWGESIRNKRKINDLLHAGRLPVGYYLLLCTKEGGLEFTPAIMQSNRYYVSDSYTVLGIAHGKNEAYEMIKDIVSYVYTSTNYESVNSYVREVLVTEIC